MNQDTQHQIVEDLAAYGFTASPEYEIANPSGRLTGAFVSVAKNNRLQVRNASGHLLWSGPRIGNFLESFWFAKRVR